MSDLINRRPRLSPDTIRRIVELGSLRPRLSLREVSRRSGINSKTCLKYLNSKAARLVSVGPDAGLEGKATPLRRCHHETCGRVTTMDPCQWCRQPWGNHR